jgi:hypothetical protein
MVLLFTAGGCAMCGSGAAELDRERATAWWRSPAFPIEVRLRAASYPKKTDIGIPSYFTIARYTDYCPRVTWDFRQDGMPGRESEKLTVECLEADPSQHPRKSSGMGEAAQKLLEKGRITWSPDGRVETIEGHRPTGLLIAPSRSGHGDPRTFGDSRTLEQVRRCGPGTCEVIDRVTEAVRALPRVAAAELLHAFPWGLAPLGRRARRVMEHARGPEKVLGAGPGEGVEALERTADRRRARGEPWRGKGRKPRFPRGAFGRE